MRGVLWLLAGSWLCVLLAGGTTANDEECSPLESLNATGISHTKLIKMMTEQCRYDRLMRPGKKQEPLNVSTRAYVYLIQSDSAQTLHFQVHLLLQFRYEDPRLAFGNAAPHIHEIVGEAELLDRIWIPHIYLSNEHKSDIMGTQAKDVLISIYPDGLVIFALRLKAILFCWMRLEKFPFDEQKCPLVLESWTYNTSELILTWEPDSPVILNPALHLTEYTLMDMWTNESDSTYFSPSYHRGPFHGNYSSLSITFHLSREIGFYMMDYYVPSILLVVISWVSFWLEANALAARIALGTSTMLTFITLSSKTGSQLPKVSYIKASEIWFLGCTAFIFGSLVEFAFVNTIYRRRRNVELVKVDAKNVLKSALTPRLARKQLMQQRGSSLERSSSCPSGMDNALSISTLNVQNSTSSLLDIPGSMTTCKSDMTNHDPNITNSIEIPVPITNPPPNTSFTTMTPQQISQWIDTRSRFFFPAAFIVFNILYWSFLWI
ncbi:pH-sensitive chloride channel 2 [Anabrus simplex]|uniref:pH-sensitive chloride channel 2 n=1 Tax=Anabrus simplex TaxID=316456 RepID=UPI0035A3B843